MFSNKVFSSIQEYEIYADIFECDKILINVLFIVEEPKARRLRSRAPRSLSQVLQLRPRRRQKMTEAMNHSMINHQLIHISMREFIPVIRHRMGIEPIYRSRMPLRLFHANMKWFPAQPTGQALNCLSLPSMKNLHSKLNFTLERCVKYTRGLKYNAIIMQPVLQIYGD